MQYLAITKILFLAVVSPDTPHGLRPSVAQLCNMHLISSELDL